MLPKSNEIRIEVTTKCNYNCVICPREKLTRKLETMDFETFRFLFDKINAETSQYDTLTFPGMGEPLMDESLDEKIIYAKKKGFTVLMLTNGSFLNVERFRRLQDIGTDSVRVSMYGDSHEAYSTVHGVNSNMYEKVKSNLTEIAAMKSTTQLLLTYNEVAGYNEETLNSWVQYWDDKADLIEVWRPHNWGDSMQFRDVQQEKLKTCGRPYNTPLQVQVDGTVNMCCFDYNGTLLLGNLLSQSLEEIFESPMYRKIENCHRTGEYSGSGLICENCDQRNADKSHVMSYNSKFDISERVQKVSTTYRDVTEDSK